MVGILPKAIETTWHSRDAALFLPLDMLLVEEDWGTRIFYITPSTLITGGSFCHSLAFKEAARERDELVEHLVQAVLKEA